MDKELINLVNKETDRQLNQYSIIFFNKLKKVLLLMRFKPLIILMGEPYSVFLEIFLKSFENHIKKKNKYPVILIGSKKILIKQIRHFNYKHKIKIINPTEIKELKNNKFINLINVNLDESNNIYKNYNINTYIEKTFNIAFKLLKDKKVTGFINGQFQKIFKKFLGVTEYILNKTKSNDVVMLIYNKILSVSSHNIFH